jgi:uncharacterized protein DUF742
VNGQDGLDDDEPSHEEEESFGRPFLGRKLGHAPVATAETSEPEDEAPGGHYRPYLLTGGRTGGGAAGVGIETVLVRDHNAIPRQSAWSGEVAMIIAACDKPVAVAEVAARVGLPIGVVQVLTGDLVTAGVLLRSASSMSLADDVLFIERLIHGVAAL